MQPKLPRHALAVGWELVAATELGPGHLWAAFVLPGLLLCCARHLPSLDWALVARRILRGEYEVPPGASPHCLDLLRRIMTVDCDKRITIPEIMRHPWFLEDLPLGLEEANASLLEAPLALQFCKQSEVIWSFGSPAQRTAQ